MSTIELKVRMDRELYYDSSSMFGVYAFYPLSNKNSVKINTYNNFVVSGTTPELTQDKEYKIEIKPSKHPKYGDGYTFVAVEPERPKTIKEQQEYVKSLVTENQFNEIIKVYPNELILDLMESDEFDFSNMKGIKESTYQNIKKKLFDNLEIHEALVELKDLDITYDAMRRLVEHFGSAELVVQKVKENIYSLCEVDLFGFKRVDKYAMNRGDDPTSFYRIESAIYYLLKQDSSNGHSWLVIHELVEELLELLNIDELHIHRTIDKLKNDSDSLYFQGDKIALYRNYYFEKTILERLKKLNSTIPKTKGIENFEEEIERQETQNGFSYTTEQKEAIQKAINNNVLIINGRAGTGKSTILKGVVKALSNYSHSAVALSGKASKILAGHGLNAMTIHRMLGFNPEGGFLHNSHSKLPYDIVILDESSMVNSYLIYSILVAMKDDAKIIFVGDSGQLPAIGTGSVFEDLISYQSFPQQELTIVHRQAQKSGILSTANKIREGNHINGRYDSETRVYGDLKDMMLIPVSDRSEIKEIILEICKKHKNKDLYEFQVITGLRGRGDISVKNLNIELQNIFNDTSKPHIKRGGYEYRVGDKIIQNGNNYEAGTNGDISIFNGTLGKIVHIDFDSSSSRQEHVIHIEFEDVDEIIEYSTSDMQQIELAYAITTHKAQGATLKNVLFAFDYSSYMLLSREFVYTGITRASDGCVMVVENSALHHAIEKTNNGSRRTFLKEMLAKVKI